MGSGRRVHIIHHLVNELVLVSLLALRGRLPKLASRGAMSEPTAHCYRLDSLRHDGRQVGPAHCHFTQYILQRGLDLRTGASQCIHIATEISGGLQKAHMKNYYPFTRSLRKWQQLPGERMCVHLSRKALNRMNQAFHDITRFIGESREQDPECSVRATCLESSNQFHEARLRRLIDQVSDVLQGGLELLKLPAHFLAPVRNSSPYSLDSFMARTSLRPWATVFCSSGDRGSFA